MHGSRFLRFAAAAAVCCLAIEARPAFAQSLETVHLKSGAVYQGQLVEKLPGEQVVIKLATGEIKRFAWSEIDHMTDASAGPALGGGWEGVPVMPTGGATRDSAHVVSGWPDPHAPPAPQPSRPVEDGATIDLGIASAAPQIGSPIGSIGALVGFKPVRWLGIEAAGGYDGSFAVSEGNLGWSVAQTARLGSVVGLGIGASEHFGAQGAGPAYMGHAEIFVDMDLKGALPLPFVVRIAPGVSGMFNPASHPGACGFFNLLGGERDDHGPNDRKCMFVYVDVDVMLRLPIGPRRRTSS